jgi:manganese transport protein
MQLSFAVFPLVSFTGDPRTMGPFVNMRLTRITSWVVAILIAGLNAWLLVQMFR